MKLSLIASMQVLLRIKNKANKEEQKGQLFLMAKYMLTISF